MLTYANLLLFGCLLGMATRLRGLLWGTVAAVCVGIIPPFLNSWATPTDALTVLALLLTFQGGFVLGAIAWNGNPSNPR